MGWFMGHGFSLQDWEGHYKGSMVREWMKGEFVMDLVASLERAGFDYLLIEDTLQVADYHGSMEEYAEAKALLVRGLARVDIVDGVPHEYIAASTKVPGGLFDFGGGRLPGFLTKLVGGT